MEVYSFKSGILSWHAILWVLLKAPYTSLRMQGERKPSRRCILPSCRAVHGEVTCLCLESPVLPSSTYLLEEEPSERSALSSLDSTKSMFVSVSLFLLMASVVLGTVMVEERRWTRDRDQQTGCSGRSVAHFSQELSGEVMVVMKEEEVSVFDRNRSMNYPSRRRPSSAVHARSQVTRKHTTCVHYSNSPFITMPELEDLEAAQHTGRVECYVPALTWSFYMSCLSSICVSKRR